MRAARRAASQHASRATPIRSRVVPTSTGGLLRRIPGKPADSSFDTPIAPKTPRPAPSSASFKPEVRTIRVTSRSRAPSAKRMANSLLRCAMVRAMTP